MTRKEEYFDFIVDRIQRNAIVIAMSTAFYAFMIFALGELGILISGLSIFWGLPFFSIGASIQFCSDIKRYCRYKPIIKATISICEGL